MMKFIFFFFNFRRQCKIWESQSDADPACNENDDDSPLQPYETSTGSILKKARSYENLRKPERRISFVHNGDFPVIQANDSFTSSSSGACSPVTVNTDEAARSESPDIQVLSRSLICPISLTSIDSSEGDLSSSSIPEELSTLSTSSTPPPKPARRHITALPVVIHTPDSNPGSDFSTSIDNDNLGSLPEQTTCDGCVESDPDNRSNHSRSVDLTEFKCSAADEIFIKRVMSIQVSFKKSLIIDLLFVCH